MNDFKRNITRRHLLGLAGGAAAGPLRSALGADAASPPKPDYAKETFVYKTVGALEIKADVYRVAGKDPQPAILWRHGGSLILASRTLVPRTLGGAV